MSGVKPINFRDNVRLIVTKDIDDESKAKMLDSAFADLVKDVREEVRTGIIPIEDDKFVPINIWCEQNEVNPITARSWVLRGVLPFKKIGKWLYINPLTPIPVQRKRGRPSRI